MLVNIILIPVSGQILIPVGVFLTAALSPSGRMKVGFQDGSFLDRIIEAFIDVKRSRKIVLRFIITFFSRYRVIINGTKQFHINEVGGSIIGRGFPVKGIIDDQIIHCFGIRIRQDILVAGTESCQTNQD